ncbi:hypothetical protein ACQR05_28465 [Bradyrhizobium oligotrophicum]|uniref:hypothetical protein n=1 Tax=Bradyrhizobium oligotrophicum TaxID=44255 RepID=UPI003EBB5F6F
MRNFGLALSLSAMMAITPVAGTCAAPLTPLSATARPAAHPFGSQGELTEVRWRGGWGIGAGLLAGALVGSALASPYYYDAYPAYDGYGYAYGPAGYDPRYAYTPYWGGYGWGAGPGFYTAYSYAPAPWGYTMRHQWRNSYGWQPRRWRHHHHGVIRTHHRW